MRVLVIHPGPAYSVADVCRGWTRALKGLGCQVGAVNYDDRLNFYASAMVKKDPDKDEYVNAVSTEGAYRLAGYTLKSDLYDFAPNIMLTVSGFFVDSKILDAARAHGTKVVLLHTESPYEDELQLKRAEHADINIVNDPTNLEKFRSIGPAYYQPHCYDPLIHYRRSYEADKASDLFFVGTGYDSRVEFLEKVDWTGIDFKLAGHWPHATYVLKRHLIHDERMCMENDEATKWYSSAKMSFNLYRRERAAIDPQFPVPEDNDIDGWALGPREIEMAATRTFFLRQPRPEGEELFPFLPTFTDPDEFGDLVRHWTQHDDARETCAKAAQAAVADRTFDNAAKRLLSHFDA